MGVKLRLSIVATKRFHGNERKRIANAPSQQRRRTISCAIRITSAAGAPPRRLLEPTVLSRSQSQQHSDLRPLLC